MKDINRHSLVCSLIHDDTQQPEFVFILPRIVSTPPVKYPFQFKRRQFPIRPAFCMTINKCQGGTFWKVGIDVSTPVFSHGQLYVALSRVGNFALIVVFTTNGVFFTKNVVFRAVFDRGYLDAQIRTAAPRPPLPGRMTTDEDIISMPPQDIPTVPQQAEEASSAPVASNFPFDDASFFQRDQEEQSASMHDDPFMPDPGFTWNDLVEDVDEEWPHHPEMHACVGIDLLSDQIEDIDPADLLIFDD